MGEEGRPPHFVFPKRILSKFIQFYMNDDEPVFRHRAFEEISHSKLLEEGVEEFGSVAVITGPVSDSDDTSVSALGNDYMLTGGGTMFYDGREISLYGLSPYNLGTDIEHLKKLINSGDIPRGTKFVITLNQENGRQTYRINA